MQVVAHETRFDEMRGDDRGLARLRAGGDEDRLDEICRVEEENRRMGVTAADAARRRQLHQVGGTSLSVDALWRRLQKEFPLDFDVT